MALQIRTREPADPNDHDLGEMSWQEQVSLGVGVVLILLGLWFTWAELRYTFSGATVKADVVDTEVIPTVTRVGRVRGRDDRTRMLYTFNDEEGDQFSGELVTFPEHVKVLNVNGKIDVIYLKSDPRVNTPVLMRHTSYAIGFCSTVAVTGLIFAFYFFKFRPELIEEKRRNARR